MEYYISSSDSSQPLPAPSLSSALSTLTSSLNLQKDGLRVGPTSLPNCEFLGLFTTEFFAKDSIVCVYTGNVLRTRDALRLCDKSYLMRLGEQCYVDAKDDLTILARYINDCIDPSGWNVMFDKNCSEQCAYVRAIRDIHPGEEIFVDYGRWYWLKKDPVRINTVAN